MYSIHPRVYQSFNRDYINSITYVLYGSFLGNTPKFWYIQGELEETCG